MSGPTQERRKPWLSSLQVPVCQGSFFCHLSPHHCCRSGAAQHFVFLLSLRGYQHIKRVALCPTNRATTCKSVLIAVEALRVLCIRYFRRNSIARQHCSSTASTQAQKLVCLTWRTDKGRLYWLVGPSIGPVRRNACPDGTTWHPMPMLTMMIAMRRALWPVGTRSSPDESRISVLRYLLDRRSCLGMQNVCSSPPANPLLFATAFPRPWRAGLRSDSASLLQTQEGLGAEGVPAELAYRCQGQHVDPLVWD